MEESHNPPSWGREGGAHRTRETEGADWTHRIGWDNKLPPKGEGREEKRKTSRFVVVFRTESHVPQGGLKCHFIFFLHSSNPVSTGSFNLNTEPKAASASPVLGFQALLPSPGGSYFFLN